MYESFKKQKKCTLLLVNIVLTILLNYLPHEKQSCQSGEDDEDDDEEKEKTFEVNLLTIIFYLTV